MQHGDCFVEAALLGINQAEIKAGVNVVRVEFEYALAMLGGCGVIARLIFDPAEIGCVSSAR